jgi:Cft2 family RNA processing exonuclease
MELVNLTRRTEIGANSYLLRIGGKTVVLDCGLHPKEEGLAATPLLDRIGPVDAIFVTHAHQDHIGSLPILTRQAQNTPVFMTRATQRIADVMLHNSVNVMLRQREEHGTEGYPLFTHRGVELCAQSWRACATGRRFNLSGERSDDDTEPTFEFVSAGHILGAAGILFRAEGRTLLYTGDVNFENQTLLRGAEFPEKGVDVLIMETTRGDSPTSAGFTRAKEEDRLATAIRTAFDRGGSVTIPVFALGKTQELLGMLWKMRLRGLLAPVPIYIGGLSAKLTTIYDSLARDAQRLHPDVQLLNEMAPYVLSGNEITTAAPRKRCVFALSSGMMTENTLSNIFARKVLADPNQSLFFIGYSDPDSPAGRIRAAEPHATIRLDPKNPPAKLNCHIDEFTFSAHASRESLLNYALALAPKTIVLVHGDRPAIEWFEHQLYRELPGTEVVIPDPGKKISL